MDSKIESRHILLYRAIKLGLLLSAILACLLFGAELRQTAGFAAGGALSASGLGTKAPAKGIPVLLYHSAVPNPKVFTDISTQMFEQHLRFLAENGYTTVSLDELHRHMMGTGSLPDKAVVLTFDDCKRPQYDNILPLLEKYHAKATFFAYPKNISENDKQYMTVAELLDLSKRGFDVQSHTWSHPSLLQRRGESHSDYMTRVTRELDQSKRWLERLTGKSVAFLAYPYGYYNERVAKAAADAGYKLAFTVNTGLNTTGVQSNFLLRRFSMEKPHSMQDFIDRVQCESFDIVQAVPKNGSILRIDAPRIAAEINPASGLNPRTLRLEIDFRGVETGVDFSGPRKWVFAYDKRKLKPGFHTATLTGRTASGKLFITSWGFVVRNP